MNKMLSNYLRRNSSGITKFHLYNVGHIANAYLLFRNGIEGIALLYTSD